MSDRIAADAEALATLRVRVDQASDVLFPSWPLESFTAVNPLGGLARESFEDAVGIAESALRAQGYPSAAFFEAASSSGRLGPEDLSAARARRAADGLPPSGREPSTTPLTPCEALDARDGGRRTEAISAELSRWCSAFLDDGQASWVMPGRERGLYSAWRAVASADPTTKLLGAGDLRERARQLPESAIAALAGQLEDLGIDERRTPWFLRRMLGRAPGWASAIKWRAEWSRGVANPVDLVQLLAIATFYEAALAAPGQDLDPGAEPATALGSAGTTDEPHPAVLLEAYEWHLRDQLLGALSERVPAAPTGRPDAQAVFCIDARSEGLRRHLERQGRYETLGFAGFFGLAIGHRELGATSAIAQCPVLLRPASTSTERPLPGAEESASRWLSRRRSRSAAIETFHETKNDLSSKFVLAEIAGWALGPAALGRTLAPRRSHREPTRPRTEPVVDRLDREHAEGIADEQERELIAELGRAFAPPLAPGLSDSKVEELRRHSVDGGPAPARPRLWPSGRWRELVAELTVAGISADGHRARVEELGSIGMTPAEQAAWARVALTMMGLTDSFARLVLLCGHGASTVNNPYRSALDCGACGGNAGAPNARVAAQLLNRRSIREELAVSGIEIPEDTVFIAGLHDTTTDRVELLDPESVPASHRTELLRLQRDLEAAGEENAAERLAELPGGDRVTSARARERARRRAADWAEVRPEWGLARNAAFVIGPRSMTQGIDLGRRVFLHSYRARVDRDGSALETILTAPLVVAQWINLQYYFSTVDPDTFGAGDKTVHNVVGLGAALTGPGGDLRLGLPLQSTHAGGEPFHEPVRLLAVVQAPLERISEIVERNAVLAEMFSGGWTALCAREDAGRSFQRLRRDLGWEPWVPAAAPTGTAVSTEPNTTSNGEERWVQKV